MPWLMSVMLAMLVAVLAVVVMQCCLEGGGRRRKMEGGDGKAKAFAKTQELTFEVRRLA